MIIWIKQWRKGKESEKVYFIPYRIPKKDRTNNYFTIAKWKRVGLSGGWASEEWVNSHTIEVKPLSEDMRNQIRYVFQSKGDYFKGYA